MGVKNIFMINLLPEIKNRVSPIIFQDKAVPKEKLDAVLEAARLAPSSYNRQPWRYIVANESAALAKAHKGLALGNFWAKQAPVIIIVISKPSFDDQVDGKEYYLYDTGLSVMLLVIEATHQGLSTHQMLGFKEDVVKKEFSIPDDWRIIVVIAMGHEGDLSSRKGSIIEKFGLGAFEKLRDRIASPRMRKELKEVVSFNGFGFREE